MSNASVPRPPVPLRHARLVHLLHSGKDDRPPFALASVEAIREARALGPEPVTEAVVAILDAYRPGGDHAFASRAAYLVHELGLAGAIPSLVGCVERLPGSDRLAVVSAASLDLLGSARIPALLAAFARATGPDLRWRLGTSLSLARAGTAGVREALESLLRSEPDAAVLLAQHGDRDAIPALRAALERLAFPAPGPDEVPGLERIITVGHAILELRGALDRVEREKLDRASARYDALAAQEGVPADGSTATGAASPRVLQRLLTGD